MFAFLVSSLLLLMTLFAAYLNSHLLETCRTKARVPTHLRYCCLSLPKRAVLTLTSYFVAGAPRAVFQRAQPSDCQA